MCLHHFMQEKNLNFHISQTINEWTSYQFIYRIHEYSTVLQNLCEMGWLNLHINAACVLCPPTSWSQLVIQCCLYVSFILGEKWSWKKALAFYTKDMFRKLSKLKYNMYELPYPHFCILVGQKLQYCTSFEPIDEPHYKTKVQLLYISDFK